MHKDAFRFADRASVPWSWKEHARGNNRAPSLHSAARWSCAAPAEMACFGVDVGLSGRDFVGIVSGF